MVKQLVFTGINRVYLEQAGHFLKDFANIYTHTGLARILKQGKINTKIDPKMAKIGQLPKIRK